MAPEVVVTDDENCLVFKLAQFVEERAKSILASEPKFYVGLSGGSYVKFLVKGLPIIKTDWKKWVFLFCDERVVPFTDVESTFGAYKKQLLDKIPVDESQFVTVNPDLNAEEAAVDYNSKLRALFPNMTWPKIHILFLGVGPDGHTCSLFPGHPLLQEKSRWVAPIVDSPKPPPSRITLTFGVLNNSPCILFASLGESKAEIVKRCINGDKSLPAALVKPEAGKVIWFLDKTAASRL